MGLKLSVLGFQEGNAKKVICSCPVWVEVQLTEVVFFFVTMRVHMNSIIILLGPCMLGITDTRNHRTVGPGLQASGPGWWFRNPHVESWRHDCTSSYHQGSFQARPLQHTAFSGPLLSSSKCDSLTRSHDHQVPWAAVGPCTLIMFKLNVQCN